MNETSQYLFDPIGGFAAISQSGEMVWVYLTLVLGIFAHWVWEVAIAAYKTGNWDWGSWTKASARFVISVIIGAVIFAGVWEQLESVDPAIRLFVAFSQGFATDALTSPTMARNTRTA